jgi:hypothetical protein
VYSLLRGIFGGTWLRMKIDHTRQFCKEANDAGIPVLIVILSATHPVQSKLCPPGAAACMRHMNSAFFVTSGVDGVSSNGAEFNKWVRYLVNFW